MDIITTTQTENTRKSIPHLQPLIYSKPAQSIAKAMPRIIHPPLHIAKHLERVVLRRNLLLEEAAQRSPHHDVVANLGDLGEEEEGEEAGNAAESGSQGAAVMCKCRFGRGCGMWIWELTYALMSWRAVMPWKLRWMVYLRSVLVGCQCAVFRLPFAAPPHRGP